MAGGQEIIVQVFFDQTDYSEVMAFSSIEEAVNNTFGEYEAIGFVIAVWRDPATGLVYSESAEEDFDAAWVKHETELLEERYDLTMANNHSEWFNLCHRDNYINDWREGVPVRRGPKAADLAKSKISRGFSVEAEMEASNV